MSATESPASLVRVAISGGRDYIPTQDDIAAFWKIWDRVRGAELHHGDARGVDRYIAAVVRRNRPAVRIVAHTARWDLLGGAAGPIRNREMMAVADVLIAFPGGRGTDDCIRAARELDRPVWRVVDADTPPHVHKPRSCNWNPVRAVWDAICSECGAMYAASPEEAERLEAAVEDYVRNGLPWE